MRLVEEGADALRHHRADVRHLEQLVLRRGHHRVQRAEVTGQRLGRGLADMADAEAEQEAWQRGPLGRFQGLKDVLAGLLGHALQAGQRAQTQPVQVRQGIDEAAVHQLVDELVTQSLDLDGPALGEVQDGLLALGAAIQAAGAPCVGLARLAHRRAAAHGANRGHREHRGARRTPLGQHADHLGDHITGSAHDHRVANPHILAPGFVLVVQGGVGDRDATDEHRRQLGHRRQLAGATDLHVDVEHRGQLLLGRVFVRDRPARLAGHIAELALQSQAVHLVDHTVDVEPEPVAPGTDALVKRYQLRSTLCPLDAGFNRKTP